MGSNQALTLNEAIEHQERRGSNTKTDNILLKMTSKLIQNTALTLKLSKDRFHEEKSNDLYATIQAELALLNENVLITKLIKYKSLSN